MSDQLLVPEFARISDYAGIWAIEASAAAVLWHRATTMGVRAHVIETPKPELVSILEKRPGPGGKLIAEVRLAGVLMKGQSSMGGTSTVMARRDVRAAMNDPDIAGIVLRVDSPGGTVAGTADLAADVKAATRVKPVWAFVDDLCASAAYWVASQCDRIVANTATALVGSIGTLSTLYDYSAAAEAQGIKTHVFRTGPLKGMGTEGDKVTPEQVNYAQALVDSTQKAFDAAVMKGRELTEKQMAGVRHGGVLLAGDAVEARLIDAVQSLDRCMADFVQAIKSGMKAEAVEPKLGAGIPIRRQPLPTAH